MARHNTNTYGEGIVVSLRSTVLRKRQNATSKKKRSNFSKFLVYNTVYNTDFEIDYVNERVEQIWKNKSLISKRTFLQFLFPSTYLLEFFK